MLTSTAETILGLIVYIKTIIFFFLKTSLNKGHFALREESLMVDSTELYYSLYHYFDFDVVVLVENYYPVAVRVPGLYWETISPDNMKTERCIHSYNGLSSFPSSP